MMMTTVTIVTSAMLFSMLANLAEDRQRRAAGSTTDVAGALQGLASDGVAAETVAALLDHALIVPVLTAHPTEVRRKSSIDREMDIARLLDERDRVKFTPEELAANRRALRRAVLTLWQTSIVRGTRLRVIDEVANGLSYYDHTFLRALPTFYVDLEDQLGELEPAWRELEVPSFLRD